MAREGPHATRQRARRSHHGGPQRAWDVERVRGGWSPVNGFVLRFNDNGAMRETRPLDPVAALATWTREEARKGVTLAGVTRRGA